MNYALSMLVAVMLDLAVGWPAQLFKRIGHPVTWIGRLIAGCEARLNSGSKPRRLVLGVMATGIVIIVVLCVAWGLQRILPTSLAGAVLAGCLAWPFSAVRSMNSHILRIIEPLERGETDAARDAVSMIVGRDPQVLDQAGIARAAIESLAENTSDGIVAPLFWGLLFGLPGICVYKAINTLDSMIGHRSDRYEAFGKCAAYLDDVANWIPARLTGFAFCCAVPTRAGTALSVVLSDAKYHRSPNAGWPEAAVAGALNLRLSGPRIYGATVSDEPWVNAEARDPDAQDLRHALALFHRVVGMNAVGLFILALL